MSEPILQTDIMIYRHSAGKFVKEKTCELLMQFLFNRREFYVLRKGYFSFVCCSVNEVPHMIVCRKDAGKEYSAGETASWFRKNYLSEKISNENIDEYLQDPEKWCKKHRRKK